MTPARWRWREHRGATAGALLVLALVGVALLGPLLTADPLARDIENGLTELGAPRSPSGSALLGTDQLGRDVWARIVSGTGTSLAIAALSMLLAMGIGLAVGLTAGYAGGSVDNVLMRLVGLVLAFPFVLLAILLAALLRQSSLAGSAAPVVVTLGLAGWTTIARVVRTKALVVMRSEHVTAARAIGAGPLRIVLRHVLPNVLGIVLVLAALGFAQMLLAEAVLSYVGLGAPPPAPTWGRMLYEGRVFYRSAPHLVLAPGIAIVFAVAAFNLLGEGLRDAVDRKERR